MNTTSNHRRTATIVRYHCYGTPRHHLSVCYLGEVLRWAVRDADGYHQGHATADMVHNGEQSIEAAKDIARKQGFTHVKFDGDWSDFAARNIPRNGKL